MNREQLKLTENLIEELYTQRSLVIRDNHLQLNPLDNISNLVREFNFELRLDPSFLDDRVEKVTIRNILGSFPTLDESFYYRKKKGVQSILDNLGSSPEDSILTENIERSIKYAKFRNYEELEAILNNLSNQVFLCDRKMLKMEAVAGIKSYRSKKYIVALSQSNLLKNKITNEKVFIDLVTGKTTYSYIKTSLPNSSIYALLKHLYVSEDDFSNISKAFKLFRDNNNEIIVNGKSESKLFKKALEKFYEKHST